MDDNILDAIYDEDNFDDDDDVDMIDVEEGELVEPDTENVSGKNTAGDGTENVSGQNGGGDINEANQGPPSKNSKRRANKKRNKRKRNAASGSKPVDINRFVLDTCRRLKEKKSYMVYTAVGCLGISALSDIVNEVDAIQACGGQKTADGRRFRTGGGVLWSIIKVREPKAYKEIMKKAKEFEKQFRQPNVKQPLVPKKEESSQGVPFSFAGMDPKEESSQVVAFAGRDSANDSDSAFPAVQMQNQPELATSKENPVSVHDRLRIPVSYDDDLLGGSPVNDASGLDH